MSILIVAVEDTAALLGIGVAAAGIFLTDITGNTVYDAIISITVGGLDGICTFLGKGKSRIVTGRINFSTTTR